MVVLVSTVFENTCKKRDRFKFFFYKMIILEFYLSVSHSNDLNKKKFSNF